MSVIEKLAFYSIPEPNSGCHLWLGRVDKNGYGQLTVAENGRRTPQQAHRLSFKYWKGPIAKGMCVCHKCDNPGCVNPDHLFLGSHLDNARDRDRKGRNGCLKLTDEQVREIRSARGTLAAIGERYGVSGNHVWMIKKGTTRIQLEAA